MTLVCAAGAGLNLRQMSLQSPVQTVTAPSTTSQVAQTRFSSEPPSPYRRFRQPPVFFSALYKKGIAKEFATLTPSPVFHKPRFVIHYASQIFWKHILQAHESSWESVLISIFLSKCQHMSREEFNSLINSVKREQIEKYFHDEKEQGYPAARKIDVTVTGTLTYDEMIPQFKTLIEKYGVSINPENQHFNRHPQILPLEATRVKLANNAYINANYCHDRRMIICQGPIDDFRVNEQENFFNMIWENDCTAIAMLTPYYDSYFEFCSHYLWQPKQSLLIEWTDDDVEYDLTPEGKARLKSKGIELSVEELQNLRKRRIYIKEITLQKDGITKTVVHFYVPDWLDGTNGDTKTIAVLAHVMLKMHMPVIHCSMGYGRSGTFASIMIAYRKIRALIEECKPIPDSLIKEVVEDLRKERDRAVQTHEQYQQIFDVLKVMFKLPLIKKREFWY